MPYLSPSTLIPLLYRFLEDSSNEVREITLQFLVSFNTQSTLILLTGLTNDRNLLVRNECVKGLAMLGIANFRSILLGLRDNEALVRSTTEQVLL